MRRRPRPSRRARGRSARRRPSRSAAGAGATVFAHAPRPARRWSRASAAIRRCPALIAARTLKIPTLIHEQNGVLGRVNRGLRAAGRARRLRHLADAAAAGREGRPCRQPGARGGARPRRRALYRAGRPPDGAPRHRRQPGRAGSSAGSCPRRSRPARPGAPGAAAAVAAGAGRGHGPGDGRLRGPRDGGRAPHLLRRRARAAGARRASWSAGRGPRSIADISVIGRPAILIPYAAATDDHQAANARGLVAGGRGLHDPRGGS